MEKTQKVDHEPANDRWSRTEIVKRKKVGARGLSKFRRPILHVRIGSSDQLACKVRVIYEEDTFQRDRMTSYRTTLRSSRTFSAKPERIFSSPALICTRELWLICREAYCGEWTERSDFFFRDEFPRNRSGVGKIHDITSAIKKLGSRKIGENKNNW